MLASVAVARTVETVTGLKGISHGQAVSMGMVAAMEISVKMGFFPEEEKNRIKLFFKQLGLPCKIPALDVEKLVEGLQALVDRGHSLVVIEHNLEVIKAADHIIDLGPEGGDGGGEVVACGSPRELLEQTKRSYTARYLKSYIEDAR